MMSALTLAVLVVVFGAMIVPDNSAEAKMGGKGLGRLQDRGCTGYSNSGQNTRGKYNRKKCRKPWERKTGRGFGEDDQDDSEYGNGDGESPSEEGQCFPYL